MQYSAEQIRALTVPTLLAILRALGVRNTGNRSQSFLVGGNCLADTFGALQRYQQLETEVGSQVQGVIVAVQQGKEWKTCGHVEQNRDAWLAQASRSEPALPTSNLPPTLVFRVDYVPGGLPMVSMLTLSWVWVPVIAHAMNIQGIPALQPDAVLYQLGAAFSLAGLVDVVRGSIQLGHLMYCY